ncbi:nAD-dependent epimerase/dehydratase [Clostridium sp. CAG:557]|nr:nAD-dependent epimerase/dehydratase [Clostridium sp. CAG:557]
MAKLVENGEQVRVIDNLSTGKKENLNKYLNEIESINGDLIDYEITRMAVKNINYVIHQATLPSVPRSIEDPIKTNLNNINATVNLLFACVRPNNVKRAVQAASSSAYGNTPLLPKIENMNPIPRSPYAASKL